MIIAMFLSLTLSKLNYDRSVSKTVAKLGRYVFIVAVACVLGYISSRPKLMYYLDLTSTNTNTLTPDSREVMKKLSGPMTITTYVNILDSCRLRCHDLYSTLSFLNEMSLNEKCL